MHFQWFLTPDERSPLVRRALAIFSIVSGCTLVFCPTSSLRDLHFVWMCEGQCQECKLKSSEYESQRSKHLWPIQKKVTVEGALFASKLKNWVRGILVRIFLGGTPDVLELSLFPSMKYIFSGFWCRTSVPHSLKEHWTSFRLFQVAR